MLGLICNLATSLSTFANNSVLESFDVITENAVVRDHTGSTLHLKSSSRWYFIKLEPHKQGNVVFSLSDINYSSTIRASNLAFGVRITGYIGEYAINPIISVDDVNDRVVIEGNVVKFQNIHGMIPVMFDQQVDSVNLEFFNNYEMDVQQYIAIHDLKIIPRQEACPNPILAQSEGGSFMFGVDGYS